MAALEYSGIGPTHTEEEEGVGEGVGAGVGAGVGGVRVLYKVLKRERGGMGRGRGGEGSTSGGHRQ